MPKIAGSLLLLVLVAAPPLAAGTVVIMETREIPDGTVETTTMSLDGPRVALASDAEDNRMIFRGDLRQMLLVNDVTKTYIMMDETQLQGFAGQMDAATQQMEEALKDLPEEQQEMARRMMRQQAPAAQSAPAAPLQEVRKTLETGTRGGYPCVKYEVLESGAKIRELWVTDWSNVEGHADLSAAIQGLSSFLERLLSALSRFGGSTTSIASSFAQWDEIDGLPIVTIEIEGGEPVEESTIQSITTATLDWVTTFEPPEDYTQRTLGL